MAYRTTTISPLFPSSRVQGGLRFVGKCYAPERSNPEGVTVAFFHCAGSHKEAWEPTIQYLFSEKDPASGKPLLREAWAFDFQSHGEASVLNAAQLKDLKTGIPVDEYGDGFRAFVATGALNGHRLVGVGHSLGTSAVVLSTMDAGSVPGVKFEAIVLVEPALITREVYNANLAEREGALKAMNKAISKRRDTWNTWDEAKDYFEQRFPWMMWDPRVRELFVRYGLKEMSVPEPDGKAATKVTLACSKDHERCAYSQDEVYYTVVDRIQSLDPSVAVHYILGDRHDLIPEYIPQSVMGVRKPASVQKIPETGHFAVQENPEGLGKAIAQILIGRTTVRASL